MTQNVFFGIFHKVFTTYIGDYPNTFKTIKILFP